MGVKAERMLMLMGKAEREVRRVERVLLVAKIQCKSLCILTGASVSSCIQVIHEHKLM